ncbi:peptidoglycan binding protein CsiV [Rheinheimera aquimaris]|uniref:Peptidoglycan binding protein CsiV n=2 Tax=Rheinheimera TaxID=67575 RepID=A0ABP3NBW0_9GAMM|nr:CsiV family protein [Rheinheimera aquimaris]MCB5212280.1 peptidoglycan binding protein CsiV [Rheinheimera aquimaris]
MSKAVSCSFIGAALFSTVLHAQEQRWFEVEMLIFSQTPPASLQESFGDAVTPIKPGRAYDLVTPLLQPDLSSLLAELPLCHNSLQPEDEYQFTQSLSAQLCIVERQQHSWQLTNLFEPRRSYDKVPYPAALPAVVTGSGVHTNKPYLAERASLQLTDIASKITRSAGTQLLLHTSWRQAPVTERRAIASRWFSGKNYSAQFDYWGQPVADVTADAGTHTTDSIDLISDDLVAANDAGTHQVMSNIDMLLQQLNANSQLPDTAESAIDTPIHSDSLTSRNLPDQVWQLDGLFKLHLDHYLFVNTEFNLRLPAQDNSLQTIYVRQSRRVISGEIHYLDHPHLGIILQIRRYEPPAEEEPELNDATNTSQ